MTEQNSTHGIERIVFEPVREGQWRMRLEGDDVEGHGMRVRFRDADSEAGDDAEGHRPIGFSAQAGDDVEGQGRRLVGFSTQPAGKDEDGEPLFKLELDGEDVEGQSFRVRI